MKLVFLGTPEFAVPTLDACVASGHEVAAVYTQPDRPKGRGQQMAFPPVKVAAIRLGLEVRQPERVRHQEVVDQLRAFQPDAMVIVGYGQIIPQSILDVPPLGIINVHASLLPKYRGAAPIQWAIANGERITGVTTMKINSGLDTGDMLRKWETAIGEEETALELGPRLAEAGAKLLVETLRDIKQIVPELQDNAQATHAAILKREDGHIDWTRPAEEIHNRIRGFLPWPGGYGFLRNSRFHIWRARVASRAITPGRMLSEKGSLFIGCGKNALEALEVQVEGKKRMEPRAFLNGFTLGENEILA